jgi:hypothetical protein
MESYRNGRPWNILLVDGKTKGVLSFIKDLGEKAPLVRTTEWVVQSLILGRLVKEELGYHTDM